MDLVISKTYQKQILSATWSSVVIALSETKVGKMRTDNAFPKLHEEAEKLMFAASINNLPVRFHELTQDKYGNYLLVMERVYPLLFSALDFQAKLSFLKAFREKLNELHQAGFVHYDFNRTVKAIDTNNYLLTTSGFRLIDMELSLLKTEANRIHFEKAIENEKRIFENIAREILNNEFIKRYNDNHTAYLLPE